MSTKFCGNKIIRSRYQKISFTRSRNEKLNVLILPAPQIHEKIKITAASFGSIADLACTCLV